MLVPFERLVRPYQIKEVQLRNGVFVQRRVPLSETEISETITSVLEWTATTSANEASIPEQQYGPPIDYTPEEQKEVDRETVTRRVENPEDPSQYVDVEDTARLAMKRKEKQLYDEAAEMGYEIVEIRERKEDEEPLVADKSKGEVIYKFNVPEG